jgi:hypothetical protein
MARYGRVGRFWFVMPWLRPLRLVVAGSGQLGCGRLRFVAARLGLGTAHVGLREKRRCLGDVQFHHQRLIGKAKSSL